MTQVLVVLPAYDEATQVGPLLERIERVLTEDGFAFEVIVVDDGSTDGTPDVVRAYQARMPITLLQHAQNQGLGATLRDGLREAVSRCGDDDVVVAMDGDNTHTPGLIRRMVRQIREGSDVVIASRYQPGSRVVGVPLHRRALSRAASVVFRLTFPTSGVKDFTCGYRAYRGAVLREAFAQFGDGFVDPSGFEVMVDVLLQLRKLNVIFSEVPLILRYDLKANQSKLKIARTVVRSLALVARRRLER